MVVIRLTRVGKKNSPAYRVVVAEKRRAVKRKFIEVIGHYNPIKKPKEVVISSERALFWLKAGAQPSDTVRNMMADLEIIPKKEKVNIKYARPKKKKELKQENAGKDQAQLKTPEQTDNKEEVVEEKKEESEEVKENKTEEAAPELSEGQAESNQEKEKEDDDKSDKKTPEQTDNKEKIEQKEDNNKK